MAQNYEGFKLAQKKSLKDTASHFDAALRTIQTACGPEWQLEVNWGSFSTNMEARDVQWISLVQERWCPAIADDLKKFCADSDCKEAVNEAVTQKKVLLKCAPSSDVAVVTLEEGVLTFTMGKASVANTYSTPYVSNWLGNNL
ncbi:hypothetical protein QOT17_014028 [Balamuthia mandrillaris]